MLIRRRRQLVLSPFIQLDNQFSQSWQHTDQPLLEQLLCFPKVLLIKQFGQQSHEDKLISGFNQPLNSIPSR